MAGEQVTWPRCGQRVLTPAHRQLPEPALPSDGPSPVPRKSVFPDLPVVLDPPEPGLRVSLLASELPPRLESRETDAV
jgi:hypothetical protein